MGLLKSDKWKLSVTGVISAMTGACFNTSMFASGMMNP